MELVSEVRGNCVMNSTRHVVPISSNVVIRLSMRGQFVRILHGHNRVVDAGKSLLAQLVELSGGSPPPAPGWIAFGDGAADIDDTQLALSGTEHARNALSSTTRINNDLTYSAVFVHPGGATPTQVVNEMGIFNAAVAGTMLARFLVQQFQFTDGASFTVDWTLTFG